jgi:hypothetical protein
MGIPTPSRAATNPPSVFNALVGLWLMISPLLIGYTATPTAVWNAVVVGVLIVACAWVRATGAGNTLALSGVNVVLGAWLVTAPFFLYPNDPLAVGNSLVVGVLTGLLALWSIAATPLAR